MFSDREVGTYLLLSVSVLLKGLWTNNIRLQRQTLFNEAPCKSICRQPLQFLLETEGEFSVCLFVCLYRDLLKFEKPRAQRGSEHEIEFPLYLEQSAIIYFNKQIHSLIHLELNLLLTQLWYFSLAWASCKVNHNFIMSCFPCLFKRWS